MAAREELKRLILRAKDKNKFLHFGKRDQRQK
eukprot:CAMPEP_0184481004 /NCGR_PEP_ID=MMETSP0113_2-20130426/2551_1 /TAXON_ID=91329 /ORGANISM="Norrisiella sphaerica, Strain BC52" /LENGTH=31 /DNA_ID= /DNA_START= /DNA_END= /DNA_ORIENTATION=